MYYLATASVITLHEETVFFHSTQECTNFKQGIRMKYRFHIVLVVALICIAAIWTTTQAMNVLPSARAQADFSCASVTEIPIAECEAIIAIVDANPDARHPGDWLRGTTPCKWMDIVCVDGHIDTLYLSLSDLATLPPEIGNLTSLDTLNLSRNQLVDLPPEIGELTSLTKLYLESNELASIPPEIGDLTSLTKLHTVRNRQLDLADHALSLPKWINEHTAGNWQPHLPRVPQPV